ncbi:hypothetical protein BV898_01008 [Hypsibius exemplaris]|uniref:Uncharacterized protein n=1 Tax=Hypsibius exemplaris TaxID=2072580 RepID=A0A1W0XCX7_HYPEX|nr:hypothetical protein BV898_01008 [Hypsibius exemplaris]
MDGEKHSDDDDDDDGIHLAVPYFLVSDREKTMMLRSLVESRKRIALMALMTEDYVTGYLTLLTDAEQDLTLSFGPSSPSAAEGFLVFSKNYVMYTSNLTVNSSHHGPLATTNCSLSAEQLYSLNIFPLALSTTIISAQSFNLIIFHFWQIQQPFVLLPSPGGAINVDRWLSVELLTEYRRRVSRRNVKFFAAASWLLTILLTVPEFVRYWGSVITSCNAPISGPSLVRSFWVCWWPFSLVQWRLS